MPDSTPPSYVRHIAKAGYAGKGLMYFAVATLALMAALGYASDPEGMRGTMHTLADLPFGRIVLAVATVGLAAYSFWRWFEAIRNPSGDDGAKGAAKRLAFAVSGAVHAALAYSAAKIVFGAGGVETDGAAKETAQETWSAIVLSWPMGMWLLIGVGFVVAAVGIRQFVRAYKADFVDKLDTNTLDRSTVRTLRRAGRIGLTARGMAFLLMGGFVVIAAWRHDPEQTRGLDGTLDVLSQQRYGQLLLAAFAIGLGCYAIYCWASAGLRSFDGSDTAQIDYTI